MKKSVGGDRLGSGSGLEVALHNYERSTHDLGKIWRSSMAVGTLVPFIREIALNGDTWDIDLETMVRTLPTSGPLFGSFKLQLDVFSVPIRLYHKVLHMNANGVGMEMDKIKFPRFAVTANRLHPDWDTPLEWQQFDQSSLWAYLGLRGLGKNALDDENDYVTRYVNGLYPLAYYDIYKQYYANKQEEIGYIIGKGADAVGLLPVFKMKRDGVTVSEWDMGVSVPGGPIGAGNMVELSNRIGGEVIAEPSRIEVMVGGSWLQLTDVYIGKWRPYSGQSGWVCTGEFGSVEMQSVRLKDRGQTAGYSLVDFNLSNIDDMKEQIFAAPKEAPMTITGSSGPLPYSALVAYDADNNFRSDSLYPMNGLAIKTYQSDIFNNWLDTGIIKGNGGVNELSKIDVSSGYLYLDDLNIGKKVQNLLNRIAVSGASYYDWQEAVYGEEAVRRADSPIYCGGMSTEIIFNEVVSNAEADTAEGPQELGSLAGKGTQAGNKKGGKISIKVDEPSIIMGLVSITPRIDYSQGNNWMYNLETMDDLHKPAMDGIGFQELITDQMLFAETTVLANGNIMQQSAGLQPAWLNYMTSYNECYGNFAHPLREMYMTLNRRYEHDTEGWLKDLTSYIDPTKYNYCFASSDLDSQNFWIQIATDMIVRRKMSAKVMPNI